MQTLKTWKEKSTFGYTGSVKEGTEIAYGRKPYPKSISATQYAKLLNHFRSHTVDIGTSRTDPPRNSVGEWLQLNSYQNSARIICWTYPNHRRLCRKGWWIKN